ncbi:MAG: hypothetical protein ABJO02_05180 [Reichenbachiella sp.]|uniref:hypothetical protein n=1 Tax=Reichenbachiella sp. TaxID=2184521 RepID=UPI00329A00AB
MDKFLELLRFQIENANIYANQEFRLDVFTRSRGIHQIRFDLGLENPDHLFANRGNSMHYVFDARDGEQVFRFRLAVSSRSESNQSGVLRIRASNSVPPPPPLTLRFELFNQ